MKNRKFLVRDKDSVANSILIEGAVTPLSGSSFVLPLKVTEEGELWTTGSISVKLNGSDIQIGAVELKDGTTDNRANINENGYLFVNNKNVIPFANYKSPFDFISTYTSNQTITLSSLPITINDSSQISYIKVVPSGSIDAKIYTNGINGITITESSNILTLTGSLNPFNSGDNYEVGINGQNKGYDSSTESVLTNIINPVWGKYTDVENLITTQSLTETYSDFGSEIDMREYNRLGIFLRANINQSLYGFLKVLGKSELSGSYEYDIDGVDIKTLWEGSGSDFNKYYEFDVGTVPYIQLQAKTTTSGSVVGNLTIDINKKWRD